MFGNNARLDIGGSFYGSTADSILFPNGIEFSATNIQRPILTINAPIGLGDIRGDSGDIINRSTSGGVGLQVPTGKNISLIGGNVSFDGGLATAPQGTISLLGNTVVLFNNVKIDVSSDLGGGQVFIGGNFQGRNYLVNATRTYIDSGVNINADALSNGNGGRVVIWADEVTGFYGNISARGGSISGNGGFVEVSGQEHLLFRGNVDTSIANGFPGSLLLDSTNIVIANDSGDATDTFAEINSNLAGSILNKRLNEFDDTAQITIYESELEGLSGNTNIVLQATNNITLQDLGEINIKALNDISFSESSVVTFSTFGQASDINISANSLSLLDGSQLSSTTFISGIGGNIVINTDSFNLAGQNEFGQSSSLLVETFGTANAGTININTSQLRVEDAGQISAMTGGQGNGGNITINASNLTLTNGGQIMANTAGGGNAGNVIIDASESVTVDGTGTTPNGAFVSSGIFTSVEETGAGNGGALNITTTNLSLTNGGQIIANSLGQGNGGDIFIQADALTLDNGLISAANNPSISIPSPEASRVGGNINLTIKDNLILDNESTISAQASENANGGNLDIDAEFILAFPSSGDGNDIIANAQRGDGGNINITAEALLGIEERPAIPGNRTNDIDASSEFGLSGNVTFNVPDTNNFQETAELSSNVVSAEAVAQDACSPSAGESGLVLLGKGGVPPAPNLPLSAEVLLGDGQPITPNFSQLNYPQITQTTAFQIQPVKTSVGDIYPARGVIKTEDGRVILTAYPTGNNAKRIPSDAANCD